MASVPTSEEQMNMFRYRDKMGLLNADFVKVINGYYQQNTHLDFTSTMQSYIDHAKKLRVMYKFDSESKESTENGAAHAEPAKKTQNEGGSGRKIAKAVRKSTPKIGETNTPKSATITSIFAASSPATTATVPTFGDISMIGKSTPAPIPKKPAAEEEETVTPAPAAAARKRAIRGGGPLGGSESVVFKGANGEEKAPSTSTATIPPTTIKFPEPSKDFWTKKSDAPAAPADTGSLFAFLGKDSNATSPPKFSGFSFGKKDEGNEKKEESPKAPGASLFGGFGAKTSETAPAAATKPLVFGEKSSESTSPPKPFGFSSSIFGSTTTTASSSDATGAPKLSFGSTLGSSAPAPAGSLFSGFAGLAQKAMAGQNQEKKDDDEEAEYVPPKAETVENEEPDAILSSKVSVFKFNGKEYTKLGVGMLHVKNTDGKHSLLIRAATTTGTVWLNALCNKAMKATKVDDKGERIRLTCPASASEMATMMIRFGTAEGAKKFTDKVEELTK